jgi:hypothetical protein
MDATLNEETPCSVCPIYPKCLKSVTENDNNFYSDIMHCSLVKKFAHIIESKNTGFTYPSEFKPRIDILNDLFFIKPAFRILN